MARPKYIRPFLVSDTWKGSTGDYGYSPDAAIAFQRGVDQELRTRVAGCFWSLLLSRPTDLGIFCDYWYSEYDGMLDTIWCDGNRIYQEFLGYPNPEQSDDDWWPFELPRKRKIRDRTKR